MARIKTAIAVFGAVIPLLSVAAGPARADHERDWRDRGKGASYKYEDESGPRGVRIAENNHRRGHPRIRRDFGYGPPPWAPAHGWRAKHRRDRHVHVEENVHVIETGHFLDLPDTGIGRCNRDVLGAIIGGASGALIGSQFGKGDGKIAATIGGAVIGLLVGGNIGQAMDDVDQGCIGQVLERAPTGQPVAWRNPDDGYRYRVTPTRTYQVESGDYCREYTTTVVIDGRPQNAYGTACRQPDGSWKKQM